MNEKFKQVLGSMLIVKIFNWREYPLRSILTIDLIHLQLERSNGFVSFKNKSFALNTKTF